MTMKFAPRPGEALLTLGSAYFFLAVVLGIGAGEVLFGRFAIHDDHI